MKYKLRKTETYSVTEATIPVELNTEDFKNSTIPYKGNSEEEFMVYIMENEIYDEDVFHDMGLPKETVDKMYLIFLEGDRETLYDSRNNSADDWYEVVELEKDSRRSYDWYEVVAKSEW